MKSQTGYDRDLIEAAIRNGADVSAAETAALLSERDELLNRVVALSGNRRRTESAPCQHAGAYVHALIGGGETDEWIPWYMLDDTRRPGEQARLALGSCSACSAPVVNVQVSHPDDGVGESRRTLTTQWVALEQTGTGGPTIVPLFGGGN